ncbi:hypothetical protein K7957_02805 [Sphingomonas yunnanensis]|uniref:hypothetical protein n=1 Tax=Sphingomonas yunnanensis TaxID=310400 RepID=UPI001CA6A737|nr:hypothetical protein [Sphingomonas yunnanensis]MBY9061859.1 hypothetical protein [Sphingomonas yunnanensis]
MPRPPRAPSPLATLPLTVAALLSLAGCGADMSGYPSLAPRPVEKLGFEEPATPPPAPVAADPALDARLAAIATARATAARDFDAAAVRATARATAARGAAAGSERWLDAQSAIAELDSLRSTHADSLNQLEELAAARAQALQPDYPALEQALDAARDTAARQTSRIDTLAASLPSG